MVLNSRKLKHQADFCWHEYTQATFDSNQTVVLIFPEGYSMGKGNLQLKDINIDGYPDIMVPLNQK